MRKVAVLTLMAMVFSIPVHAVTRYDAQTLSCSRIQTVLQTEGAVILRYQSPRNTQLTLYDTYASNSGNCEYGQYAKPSWVPSQDKRRCRVRVCVDQSSDY